MNNILHFIFILDYNHRKISVDSSNNSSTSSSEYNSENEYSDSSFDNISLASHEEELVQKIIHHTKPIRITLKLHITETTFSTWETVFNPDNQILYVSLPSIILPEASKHSFITLLEFAEERLEVSSVVLIMKKDREDRQQLVRTFLFLGFQPLSPKSRLAPPHKMDDGNLFMIYNTGEE